MSSKARHPSRCKWFSAFGRATDPFARRHRHPGDDTCQSLSVSRLLVNSRTAPIPAVARPPAGVRAFHRRLPGYGATELLEMPSVADARGRRSPARESRDRALRAPRVQGARRVVGDVPRAVDRLGDVPEWNTLSELGAIGRAALGDLRLVVATDGNHGRAIAWMARQLGLRGDDPRARRHCGRAHCRDRRRGRGGRSRRRDVRRRGAGIGQARVYPSTSSCRTPRGPGTRTRPDG